ncbi:haloacid dehalogenase [Deinococcus piscis]|uniref:Haloacid dehalogenase n=1 Tax=Deinococcus piscis TaxID=394230 RepID=A0ABQ3K654_9DEIO|nr:HAD family hydrolase [Deinococcus piscis]GHG05392.1 haloacid dehalogenase [Deinococcus piscis]
MSWKKGLIFDLDDTLYLEQQYVTSGFGAVGSHLSPEPEQAALYAQKLHSYVQQFGDGRAFDHLLEEFPQATEGLTVQQLVEVYRSHMPTLELDQVWREQLQKWRDAGVFLGLISDGALIGQQNKVNVLELESLFDHLILTDQLGREFWKPHRRAYELMQQVSGLQGPQLIYIGDNVLKDFIAPRALGWHTVRLRLPGQVRELLEPASEEARPQAEARSVAELISQLETWLRSAG